MLSKNLFPDQYVFSQKLITLLDALSKVNKRNLSISIQAQVSADLIKRIIEYDEIFSYVGADLVKEEEREEAGDSKKGDNDESMEGEEEEEESEEAQSEESSLESEYVGGRRRSKHKANPSQKQKKPDRTQIEKNYEKRQEEKNFTIDPNLKADANQFGMCNDS